MQVNKTEKPVLGLAPNEPADVKTPAGSPTHCQCNTLNSARPTYPRNKSHVLPEIVMVPDPTAPADLAAWDSLFRRWAR